MSRLLRVPLRLFSGSKFYHPPEYKYDAEYHLNQANRTQSFVNIYRRYAHNYAELDPLKLYDEKGEFATASDLQINTQMPLIQLDHHTCFLAQICEDAKELEQKLRAVYKSKCGVEFEQVTNLQERTWLYYNFEKTMTEPIPDDKKKEIASLLVQTEALDHFLHKKFVTFKRYSGEGAEAAVVALKTLFETAAEQGISEIVMGIPHRGRLNVLVNLLNYPASDLFRKISGKTDTPMDLPGALDDVTSHLAQSIPRKYETSKGVKEIYISTVHNPSHLEAQNAVSMGKTKSKQINDKANVMNLQIHGDSAFSAQGIVYESLCLGKVPYYKINGTVHMIVNNQIGYTTRPIHSRPSKYCSDIAKTFAIPVIHVNGESIEDVHRVMKFAVQYREKFHKDILIDLIVYRRYGHNEVDQPEFTQPRMYKQIREAQKTFPLAYFEKLRNQGLFQQSFYQDLRKSSFDQWEKDYNQSKTKDKITLKQYSDMKRAGSKTFTLHWKGFKPSLFGQESPTNVKKQLLLQYAKASVFTPPNFNIHQRIQKFHIDDRLKSIQKNALNWATCESIAFFSLCAEGFNIRMTGQDVERGTFSQRHMNFTDQKTEEQFNPLEFFAEQSPDRGKVDIHNSPLSQNAVMSYEYGYSIDNPHNLAIWEAQFGDFFNPAQVVVDTYVTNGEAKWLRQSGLVLVLPHGYDGAGPEHSSCRIQRFLQLANTDGINRHYKYQKYDQNRPNLKIGQKVFYQNIQEANFSFVYPTTPANYFHLLRRQVKRNFRKPLVMAGPKTLLRHPRCLSKFEDLSDVTHFQRILHYTNPEVLKQARNVIICSGKYVYDIENLVKNNKISDVSVITLEELFPFPEEELKDIISKTKQDVNTLWVQEENMNSGPYMFVEPHISRILKELNRKELKYAGRRALAMTAVGSSQLHSRESRQLSEFLLELIK